jgi:hypothetical protein
MSRMSVRVVSLVLALPVSALAGEVVYQFQTEEDPQAVRSDLSPCQAAPFQANVKAAGLVSVPRLHAPEGRVEPGDKHSVGSALACLRITDRTFAEGSQADIYASFELPEGHFAASGRCTVVSNAVPRQGVVLATCALKLTEFPEGYAGGFATSASLFNPLGVPGYSTGSLWTLRVFERTGRSDSEKHW